MSDQEEKLRRRIECVMINAETRHGGDGTYAAASRALIKEFGLTVESSMFGGRKDEGAPYRASRVVGKWEKQ